MKIDIHSGTWAAIEEYVEGRLVELRTRLESDLSDKDTAAVRASIREMKKLLAEAKPDGTQYVELDTPQQE